jgi:lipopolysaccharide export system permease protein
VKVLDRYILSELIKALLIIGFSIVLLFLIFDFSLNAGKFFKAGVDFSEIADYYFKYLPSLLSNLMPMALLLSLFWSMNRLNRNREIIAMQASGISILRICIPLLCVGLGLAFFDYMVEEEVNTKNAKALNRFIERIKGQKSSEALEKQYLFTDINSSLLWFPKFDPETLRMDGLVKWECYGADDNPVMNIIAASGEYIADSWWLYDVTVVFFRKVGKNYEEVIDPHKYKRRLMLEWDFRPTELSRNKDFSELRVSRLKKRIVKYREIQPEMARNMSIELHNRFALPLMNVVALLLSIPFAFRVKSAKSVLGGIGVSVLLVFAYYGIYTTCIILGKHGFFVPYIVWAPNMLFSGLGAFLIKLQR